MDDRELRDAEQQMRLCLARLANPGCRKAAPTIVKVWKLWAGWDGTRAMRGVRIPPTSLAVRRVASQWEHQPTGVRATILAALYYAGEHVSVAVDAIARGLEDEDATIRRSATRLLALVGTGQTPPIELTGELEASLRRNLEDAVWSIRWLTVQALARSKRGPAEALAAVLLASFPRATLANATAGAAARLAGMQGEWLDAARTIQPVPAALARAISEIAAPGDATLNVELHDP